MSLEKYFCSSPWFHMRILNDGSYNYCRWSSTKHESLDASIKTKQIKLFFQKDLSNLRTSLLNGESIESCADCYKMEQYQKVSGRQKQLLKVGIGTDNFIKTSLTTPWKSVFEHSAHNNGNTDQLPQDWQIDLGNHCNSACMFCHPDSSSRLANEFKTIGLINNLPKKNWSTDDELLNSFLEFLSQSKNLNYLHFIGGETLITPAFKKILEKLISNGLNKKLTIGITTNLTVWQDDVYELLQKFDLHVGLSIECLHPVNEYIRYGGNYEKTLQLLDKWVAKSKQNNWTVSIRTTPTLLSILYLDTVYEYCLKNKVFIESCNFLNEPKFLRPSVLPTFYRQQVLEKISLWLHKNLTSNADHKIINIRNKSTVDQQIIEDFISYKNYLEKEPDESFRLPDTVSYIKKLESTRQNSVIDYLPEYEELFRTAGY